MLKVCISRSCFSVTWWVGIYKENSISQRVDNGHSHQCLQNSPEAFSVIQILELGRLKQVQCWDIGSLLAHFSCAGLLLLLHRSQHSLLFNSAQLVWYLLKLKLNSAYTIKTKKHYLLNKVDPGEVEADEDSHAKDVEDGDNQVPQPAKYWGVGAKHSQTHHPTVLQGGGVTGRYHKVKS